jgi:hypothetical protein
VWPSLQSVGDAAARTAAGTRDSHNTGGWELTYTSELSEQSQLLRDVFGNPFIPQPIIDPTWLTCNNGTVKELALAAYEERALPSGHLDGHRLAVLADALEDAGCNDAVLLEHLRGPGPHARGCFAVDLLLGKS